MEAAASGRQPIRMARSRHAWPSKGPMPPPFSALVKPLGTDAARAQPPALSRSGCFHATTTQPDSGQPACAPRFFGSGPGTRRGVLLAVLPIPISPQSRSLSRLVVLSIPEVSCKQKHALYAPTSSQRHTQTLSMLEPRSSPVSSFLEPAVIAFFGQPLWRLLLFL